MIKKCIFCGKKREGKNCTATDWISHIDIVNSISGHVLQRMTICPICREKHKISELYGKSPSDYKNEADLIITVWDMAFARIREWAIDVIKKCENYTDNGMKSDICNFEVIKGKCDVCLFLIERFEIKQEELKYEDSKT